MVKFYWGASEDMRMEKEEQRKIIELLELLKTHVEGMRSKQASDRYATRLAYIKRYLELYAQDEVHITQRSFVNLHKLREESGAIDENAVRQYMQDFRIFLEDFFKEKGKSIPYCLVLPRGQYYLLLDKTAPEPVTDGQTADVSAWLRKKLTGFLNIVCQAYSNPVELATESKGKAIKLDALLMLVPGMFVAVAVLVHYVGIFDRLLPRAGIGHFTPMGYALLCPLSLLFIAVWLAATAVPLHLSFKFFGGNASFVETLNFQFYFVSSWIPFLFLGRLAALKLRILDSPGGLPEIVLICAVLFMSLQYLRGLSHLNGLQPKRGLFPFLLAIAVTLYISTLLF